MVAGPTIVGVIGSLETTTIDEFTATPAAPLTGVVLTTLGAVLSAADEAEVVKALVNAVMVWPARSRRPLTVTV